MKQFLLLLTVLGSFISSVVAKLLRQSRFVKKTAITWKS